MCPLPSQPGVGHLWHKTLQISPADSNRVADGKDDTKREVAKSLSPVRKENDHQLGGPRFWVE